MADKKEIQEELQALDNIKSLAENYEEIAAQRMQRIRGYVIQARNYLSELSEVYVDLKTSYEKEVQELLDKREKDDKSLPKILQKNSKTLLVYMSSNGRLYGAVTRKTYTKFIEELKKFDKDKIDLLIIGSAGKEMYESSSFDIPYEYVYIHDEKVNAEDIKKLMQKFLLYTKVIVYHGTFINVVRQNAISSSITGDEFFEKKSEEEISQEERFIFEPSFEKILRFFETQIMSALFKQTFSENRLARQASRVNAMEQALIHIEDEREIVHQEKIRLKHLTDNKKQLDRLSGYLLWETD
ncbi:F0F1 ATP synthase subunit gamma [Candidatus Woesebacteria bacterium]|nr:F0F1 ATP synthase subunit gamma [Candidatus Woesebacteria bacterium]